MDMVDTEYDIKTNLVSPGRVRPGNKDLYDSRLQTSNPGFRDRSFDRGPLDAQKTLNQFFSPKSRPSQYQSQIRH